MSKQQQKRFRKRKHTTATKSKRMVMSANSETHAHLRGQVFWNHELKGLGSKMKGTGTY